MKRSNHAVTSAMVLMISLGGGMAASYGCGSQGDSCAELGDCGPFQTPAGIDGGTGKAEDCLNGEDDDGDGDVDCADADCGDGHVCADAVPEADGWEGLYRLVPAVYPSDLEAKCADKSSAVRYYAGPATECPGCACKPSSQAKCAKPKLMCSAENDCANTGEIVVSTECADINNNAVSSCRLEVPDMKDACISQTATDSLWKMQIDVCQAAVQMGKGCADDKVCVHMAVAGEFRCIRKAEHVDCPDNWGSPLHVYSSGDDWRNCSQCNCDPAGCGGGFRIHKDFGCANAIVDMAPIMSTNCSVVPNFGPDFSVEPVPPTALPSCIPTGGEVQGQGAPQGPVTFCCK